MWSLHEAARGRCHGVLCISLLLLFDLPSFLTNLCVNVAYNNSSSKRLLQWRALFICAMYDFSKGIVVIVIRAAVWEGSLCGLSWHCGLCCIRDWELQSTNMCFSTPYRCPDLWQWRKRAFRLGSANPKCPRIKHPQVGQTEGEVTESVSTISLSD